MKAFSIKFGLDTSANQATIIDKLKNAGMEVIQVSDGLVAKSSGGILAIKNELGEMGMGLSISELDTDEASKDAKRLAGLD